MNSLHYLPYPKPAPPVPNQLWHRLKLAQKQWCYSYTRPSDRNFRSVDSRMQIPTDVRMVFTASNDIPWAPQGVSSTCMMCPGTGTCIGSQLTHLAWPPQLLLSMKLVFFPIRDLLLYGTTIVSYNTRRSTRFSHLCHQVHLTGKSMFQLPLVPSHLALKCDLSLSTSLSDLQGYSTCRDSN